MKINWKDFFRDLLFGFGLFLFLADILGFIYFKIGRMISDGADLWATVNVGFFLYLVLLVLTIILMHKNRRKWLSLLFALIFFSIFFLIVYLIWNS